MYKMRSSTLNFFEMLGRGYITLAVIFTYAKSDVRYSFYFLICIILFLWTFIPFYTTYFNKKEGVKE